MDRPIKYHEVNKRKNMHPKKSFRQCVCFCSFSAFLLVSGIVIICVRTLLYDAILNKMLTLQPDTQTYDLWKINPVSISLKLHLFNWTNPHDVYNSSIKPKFQELGPYTFDETKRKVNITWNENNNTVSFYNLKRWWYNQARSKGSLTDPVTSVNPIALSSSIAAKDWNFIIKKGLNIFLGSVSSKPHVTHSVGEVLFDGYQDPLLSMANQLPTLGTPTMPQFDKFGWFYTRNDSETYEGHFNMDTGVTGQIGEVYSWKFMNYTPYFPEHCGKVSGSTGDFFPSNLRKDTIIRFFSADLCRFVELEFEKEVVVNGVLGYKYVAGDRFLDNGTKIPENKCFCNENCLPYGALDISACRFGSPAYVSLPHFHKADPYYTSVIEGVKSDNETHDFFMIFEPKTGVPLQVAARLQVNLRLQPVPGITIFDKAPDIVIPVLWFEQSVLIPEDIIFFVTILLNLEVICLAVGVIVIFISVLLEVCCCYKLCSTGSIAKETPVIDREEVPLTNKKDYIIGFRIPSTEK